MYFKFLLCCLYVFSAELVARANGAYFNSTAHALKVYGHSYYNPMTGEPLEGQIEDTGRLPFVAPKISFRGLPCACADQSCGCCAGLNISAIKFDRRYCANFTYDPTQLAVDVKVMMNEDEIYNTSISARNPPPVCVPLPYIPVLDFCMRLYDLSLPGGNNLQTCIDFEARVAQSPLLVMHFNCVRVGADGLTWIKPGDTVQAHSSSQQPTLLDVYDPVDFEMADDSDGIDVNATTLSPEDEDKIGQHRIP